MKQETNAQPEKQRLHNATQPNQPKTDLEKEIERLAIEQGYPNIKLSHQVYMKVLQTAHDNVFNKQPEKTANTVTEKHYHGKVHLGSELPGDEYSVNIITEEKQFMAAAKFNVYFDSFAAEANAARIVECWNGYDKAKEANKELIEALEAMVDYFPHTTYPSATKALKNAQNVIAKHTKP